MSRQAPDVHPGKYRVGKTKVGLDHQLWCVKTINRKNKDGKYIKTWSRVGGGVGESHGKLRVESNVDTKPSDRATRRTTGDEPKAGGKAKKPRRKSRSHSRSKSKGRKNKAKRSIHSMTLRPQKVNFRLLNRESLSVENRYDRAVKRNGRGKLLTRPSPSISAALTAVGTIERGNNGNMWIVKQNSKGVKTWRPYHS